MDAASAVLRARRILSEATPGVERFLGKEEVMGSIPIIGSG